LKNDRKVLRSPNQKSRLTFGKEITHTHGSMEVF